MYNAKIMTLETSTSLAADFNSHIVDANGMDWICFEYSYTGLSDSTGVLKVQGSLSGLNWCDISDASATLVTSGDHGFFDVEVRSMFKYRLVWTANTNTTGTLTVLYGIKIPLSNGVFAGPA